MQIHNPPCYDMVTRWTETSRGGDSPMIRRLIRRLAIIVGTIAVLGGTVLAQVADAKYLW